MESIMSRLSIQFRLDISVGSEAIGTTMSIKPGYFCAKIQVSMPPSESDDEPQMAHSKVLGHEPVLGVHHVFVVVLRDPIRRPSEGLLDLPWPMASAGSRSIGWRPRVAPVRRVRRRTRGRACLRRLSRAVQDEYSLARGSAKRSCSESLSSGRISPVRKRKSRAIQSPSFGAG